MALVGEVRLLVAGRCAACVREQRGQPAAGVAPGEAHDLDRQPEALAQPLDAFRRLGHHHESPRGADDDLLAQQRAATALDQAQRRVDLIGAVEGEVELDACRRARRSRCRPPVPARACARRPRPLARCRRARRSARPASRQPTGPQPDRHLGLDQLQRRGGRRRASGIVRGRHSHGVVAGDRPSAGSEAPIGGSIPCPPDATRHSARRYSGSVVLRPARRRAPARPSRPRASARPPPAARRGRAGRPG